VITLNLPWPPSINHYYGTKPGGFAKFIGAKGKAFRSEVVRAAHIQEIKPFHKNDRLHIRIDLFPPDKRKRDIDNILKALFDSLEHARIIDNDSQFDRLYIQRHDTYGGCVRVTIHKC